MDDPFELSRQLGSSDAYRVHLRLQALQTDYYVFHRNYEDLWRLLTVASTPEQIIQLYDLENYNRFIDLTKDIDRLLNNFLSSVKSLVDHTRIFIETYYVGHPFSSEYDSKKDETFVNDAITSFIHDLRNYTLHYRLTLTRGVMRYSAATEITPAVWSSDFILEKETLLRWKKWTSVSKEFLSTDNDPIVITNVVFQYHQKVQAFHTWLHERLRVVHAGELAWVEEMQARIRAATDAP